MNRLFSFWVTHRAELATLVAQHVVLVAASTAIAVLVGVPLGVFASKRPRLAAPAMAIAGIVQTIPSLAMFGFLLPAPFVGGVGARAALVVLILYGLLPIVRTTIAGMRGIDPAIREAGVAMGMTPRELLRLVELPLALPSILAGVRVAAVVGVGSATIAAAIGAGGLGEYIYRGLSMVDTTVILAGAIPAAALAVLVDTALLGVERQLSARRRTRRFGRLFAATAASLAAVALLSSAVAARRGGGALVVGSKNFTEQLVLGELLAQTIERQTRLTVDRRLNLGGTLICDRALLGGDIDVYVEYTGTALTAVLKQPPVNDPENPGFSPRGGDVDRNGVFWTSLASGHLASFDRRKCKGPLNGPSATGTHCPEGWTLYPFPGPQFKAVLDQGSVESSYYTWIDQFDTFGLGRNVPIATGNLNEGLLALVDGKFMVLRVPYPLGYYAKWLDGRIDDAKKGWKGRGLWSTVATRAPFHLEGGKGTRPKVVRFQLRPSPLAD